MSLQKVAPPCLKDARALQLSRLEGRAKALAAGSSANCSGASAAVEVLTKARVSLTLKNAAYRARRDAVKTLQGEVIRREGDLRSCYDIAALDLSCFVVLPLRRRSRCAITHANQASD